MLLLGELPEMTAVSIEMDRTSSLSLSLPKLPFHLPQFRWKTGKSPPKWNPRAFMTHLDIDPQILSLLSPQQLFFADLPVALVHCPQQWQMQSVTGSQDALASCATPMASPPNFTTWPNSSLAQAFRKTINDRTGGFINRHVVVITDAVDDVEAGGKGNNPAKC